MDQTNDTQLKYGTEHGVAPMGSTTSVEQQRAITEVQGAIISAKRFPRDMVAVIDRIKIACQRPTLAAQALYSYSKGGADVTGPSIRLMEAIAQSYGNVSCGIVELSRSNGVSECMAYAWDMETNFRDEKKFQVRHWLDTRSGGRALKDEREIYEMIANMGSRRKRACLMAVIPGDVVEDATVQCEDTLKARVQITPEKLKSMVEAFAAYGVTQAHIEQRIQRKLDAITPAQMVSMGKVLNSLKDGMSKPGDWFVVVNAAPQTEGMTPAEMSQAKKELKSGDAKIEDILAKRPNLKEAQVEELRTYAQQLAA